MGRVQDKVAVITGGGSGIARSTAKMLAAEGAKIVIAEKTRDLADSAAQEIVRAGGKAIAIETDVLEEDSVRAAIARTREEYGRLDILFNCVGGSHPQDSGVANLDLDVWNTTIRQNLLGTFLCCHAAIPIMVEQKKGVIVNTGTWGALHGSWPKHAYVTAKGGLISLTRAIAGEYTKAGIRANLITPGSIKTEQWLAKIDSTAPIIQQRKALADRYPFSVGEPEHIASIVLFLVSDESRMITGAVIPADGGRSAF